MKALTLLLALLALPAFGAPKAAEKKTGGEISVEEQTQPRWVVILGVFKEFPEAKTNALKFAKASKVPFSMNGKIFDKKGLRLPDDAEDPIYAGEYVGRRYNIAWEGRKELPAYISIERSDAYEGFAKGFYIIVGTIAETKEDGLAQTERFKAFAPDTYVKRTRIYMGCIH